VRKIDFSKFGPGILYAAAAIGVSHLVQSTRAGASFGFELVWVIVFANLIKYPFYKISPIYTSLTNKSLIHAYRKQGKWAVYLFLLLTLSTMFIIQSAITVVTSGLFAEVLNIDLSLVHQSLIILIFSSALILIGKFNLLDNFVKFIIVILTITTAITVISALTYTPTNVVQMPQFSFLNKADIFFFIALIGWMPAPMDIPVWQSMWTLAKNKKDTINIKDALLDFNVGFVATALLAIGFLSLGALIMYPTGEAFSSSAIQFSKQLISLYTGALGNWSYYLISIAACTTMFSTTITCLDAFGRITSESFKELGASSIVVKREFWVVLTALGAFIILQFYIANMKALVDLATTISFLAAPLYAILNFNVIRDKVIPKEFRYSKFEYFLCYLGLLFFTLFSLYYVWIKFIKVN
jgi:Mn2+/Fe2+ NRAMP family transporter